MQDNEIKQIVRDSIRETLKESAKEMNDKNYKTLVTFFNKELDIDFDDKEKIKIVKRALNLMIKLDRGVSKLAFLIARTIIIAIISGIISLIVLGFKAFVKGP